jgi:hypothetical protein
MFFTDHLSIPSSLRLVVNPDVFRRKRRLRCDVVSHKSQNVSNENAGRIKRTASGSGTFQGVLKDGNQWSIPRKKDPGWTIPFVLQGQRVNELKSSQGFAGPRYTCHKYDVTFRLRAGLLDNCRDGGYGVIYTRAFGLPYARQRFMTKDHTRRANERR